MAESTRPRRLNDFTKHKKRKHFNYSKYFCGTARKRGYVYNLPINNRFPLLPLPPRTIHEALPLTRKWWPSRDTRTKLNSLQTCIGSAKLTDRNKLAPLEPDEVDMLLGFPKNHTRGGGISRTDRYKSLGNSFQVDTVAYHLFIPKDLFPAGINLLSLFSGFGGNIVKSWWEQTNQKGNLINIADEQQLNGDRPEQLMNSFGRFLLIVGRSPRNNLKGSNRHSRDGLEGKESSLFYNYFQILDLVECIMSKGY
ncbi:hypothetical protein NL676_006178 [Syzygium grande]|nr:hypothetical protein NL676_006178 [Syzygium grande]